MQLYQEYFIKEINNYNIIVANWRTGAGVDFAIDRFIVDMKNVAYIGYKSVLSTNYSNALHIHNIVMSRLDKLYSSSIDVLIIDYNENVKRKLTEILDYCISHNVKVIIKQNYRELEINHKHYYSDGTMTIQKDRERKLKRVLKRK